VTPFLAARIAAEHQFEYWLYWRGGPSEIGGVTDVDLVVLIKQAMSNAASTARDRRRQQVGAPGPYKIEPQRITRIISTERRQRFGGTLPQHRCTG
jgi:hypothetical protein